ncbi:MAG: hypothetical protein ACQEVA_09805 [Myxococcota bacterium]
MNPRIQDAIVLIEPDRPGERPAAIHERGGTPILVLLLRQLLELGIDHVTVSASRADERAIRPVIAGHDHLPVCEMVAGPREGPDSSAAAFYRCRRQLDSIPLLVTRGSLLPEPGTWLDEMLDETASSAAVFPGDAPHRPSWSTSVALQEDRIVVRSPEALASSRDDFLLAGTYALDASFADALYRSLSSQTDAQRRMTALEAAILALVDEAHPLEAVKSAKIAWSYA